MPEFRGHDSMRKWAAAWVEARSRQLVRLVRRRTTGAFYARCLSPGDLAFDIGANHGVHALAMSKRGARVIALEPQEELAAELTARRLPRVTVLRMAAGPNPGTAILKTSSKGDHFATVREDWPEVSGHPAGTWDGTEEVAVVTLDGLIEEYGTPTMLKVDCEGFEERVFAGLTHPIEHILFEVQGVDPETARAIFERVGSLGRYEYRVMPAELWNFGPVTDPLTILANLPLWGNVHARLLTE